MAGRVTTSAWRSTKGGPDRDGCAACIFGVTLPHIGQSGSLHGARVVLLDWDIVSLAQGGVNPWFQHVRELAWDWFMRLKPLQGLPQAWVEPAGNAPSIIEAARKQGFNPHEVPSEFVMLGKDNRAVRVEPHVSAGRVKISACARQAREFSWRYCEPLGEAGNGLQDF